MPRRSDRIAPQSRNLLTLQQTLALFQPPCPACVAGSNAWAVSGARTASGKPLLSNDMHLSLSVPGLWYEADLEAANPAPLAAFHAAGVTLPGTPFVVAGHNDHVAWGFTNLGADVQDLYIEHTRGTPTGAEYQTANGIWRPIRYHTEVIHVRGGADVTLDVPLTHHGNTDTPIVSSLFPGERRTLSLRWTIYDPANITAPFFAVNSATDWPSMLAALANCGGPAQNLIYADDQGHIGYHAVGRIPLRGDVDTQPALARPHRRHRARRRHRTSGPATSPSTSCLRPSIRPAASSPPPTPASPRTTTATPSPSTGRRPTAPSASTRC